MLTGTNTMHCVADAVQAAISVPLLHIVDVTGRAILAVGLSRVLLLGTLYTMEQPFYKEKLARMGVGCMIPDQEERVEVHDIIFDELCKGDFPVASRNRLRAIVRGHAANGAQGVILGCTELPLILAREDVSVALFDTTELHALAAVDFAMGVPAYDTGTPRPMARLRLVNGEVSQAMAQAPAVPAISCATHH